MWICMRWSGCECLGAGWMFLEGRDVDGLGRHCWIRWTRIVG